VHRAVKNVSTGTVIRAKRGTEPSALYWLEWKNRIAAFRLWTHSLNPLKCDKWRRIRSRQVNSMYYVIAINQYTCGREKKLTLAFSSTRFFLRCVFWLNDTSYTAKVSEGTNRNMPARNTLVQLLALYANPESHNAPRHKQTDRRMDGQTDDRMMPIADHTV